MPKPDSLNRHPSGVFQVFSLNGPHDKVRTYRKRRAHSKTTNGCLVCRAYRVKCDEVRPVCTRCHRNSRSCVYGNSDGSRSDCREFSLLSSVTALPFPVSSARGGTPLIHLMQHCHQEWSTIFGFPTSTEILELTKSLPLVRNTVMAVAACHLRHVSAGDLRHRVAEHYYQNLALQDFRKLASTPAVKLGQSGVNALLFSAVLLNMLAFTLPVSETSESCEPDLGNSWVFSLQEDRLAWLAMHGGLRHLIRSTTVYSATALNFLAEVFVGLDAPSTNSSFLPNHADKLPQSWVRFLESEDSRYSNPCVVQNYKDQSTSQDDRIQTALHSSRRGKFRPVLEALSMTLGHLAKSFNVFNHLAFLLKVHIDFRNLLYHRDERALWLLGYWLNIMSRFESQWWFEKRVKRDSDAIRNWLDQSRVVSRPGFEGELWREMITELN